MAVATKTRSKTKPTKPYPSFPLTPHPNGQWCKKIRGRLHFFGVWFDPDAALTRYHQVAADLHEGRTPRSAKLQDSVLTVKDVCNGYLGWQKDRLDSEEIGARWFEDCRGVLKAFANAIGKHRGLDDLRPEDFRRYRTSLSKRLGLNALTRHITVIRSVFKFAYDNDLIAQPIKFGSGFGRPTATQFRKERQKAERENGKKLFTSDEVRSLLGATNGYLHSAILLGVNGGFGNTDCATLPEAAVDLTNGVITYARPKTGVERVVPLWPESVATLRKVLNGTRPKPASDIAAQLVFRTPRGMPLVRQNLRNDDEDLHVGNVDELSSRFSDLLTRLKINRKRRGFYTLRHSFRTWADETNDQHAIHMIMGHAIPGMSGIYVEEISLDRLRAVVDHVRSKLFS